MFNVLDMIDSIYFIQHQIYPRKSLNDSKLTFSFIINGDIKVVTLNLFMIPLQTESSSSPGKYSSISPKLARVFSHSNFSHILCFIRFNKLP